MGNKDTTNTKNTISVIIPFKDREINRLHYLYDSFDSEDVIEFIVVDYGSKKPLSLSKINKDRSKFKVIRNDNLVWNKAHALNIGIKKALGEFIMTVDVDIILVDKLNVVLDEHCFYYSSNVRRIKETDLGREYPFGWDKSFPWHDRVTLNNQIFGMATGGMQIFHKKWMQAWKGIDENLCYMGGMDNITISMAKITNLTIVQLSNRLLHVEHSLKKEDNFGDDKNLALYIKSQRGKYLLDFINIPKTNKYYGNKNPYCPMLKVWKEEFSKKKIYTVDTSKSILIAVISNRPTLPLPFVKSLISLYNETLAVYPNTTLKFARAAEVSNMRNMAVKGAIDEFYDYLICLDDDQVYQPDTIIKLMSHNKNFVTVPTKQRVSPFMPTQYKKFLNPLKQKDNFLFVTKGMKGPDGKKLVECAASGPVAMLMSVDSLRTLKYPYYEMGYKENPVMSSDLMFCKKLKKAGYKIYVDTTINCPHLISGLISSFGKDSEITLNDGSIN